MPLRCSADWALSVKVLMPFFDHQLFELGRNRLGLRDITQLHPLGFSQLDTVVQIEHRLSGSATDVDVNWFMVVAVEKENKSVFFKNLRHACIVAGNPTSGQFADQT